MKVFGCLLITASAVLARTCQDEALSVKNIGESCWAECNMKGGYCDHCGAGMACCHGSGNFEDDRDRAPECDGATHSTKHEHQCVAPRGDQCLGLTDRERCQKHYVKEGDFRFNCVWSEQSCSTSGEVCAIDHALPAKCCLCYHDSRKEFCTADQVKGASCSYACEKHSSGGFMKHQGENRWSWTDPKETCHSNPEKCSGAGYKIHDTCNTVRANPPFWEWAPGPHHIRPEHAPRTPPCTRRSQPKCCLCKDKNSDKRCLAGTYRDNDDVEVGMECSQACKRVYDKNTGEDLFYHTVKGGDYVHDKNTKGNEPYKKYQTCPAVQAEAQMPMPKDEHSLVPMAYSGAAYVGEGYCRVSRMAEKWDFSGVRTKSGVSISECRNWAKSFPYPGGYAYHEPGGICLAYYGGAPGKDFATYPVETDQNARGWRCFSFQFDHELCHLRPPSKCVDGTGSIIGCAAGYMAIWTLGDVIENVAKLATQALSYGLKFTCNHIFKKRIKEDLDQIDFCIEPAKKKCNDAPSDGYLLNSEDMPVLNSSPLDVTATLRAKICMRVDTFEIKESSCNELKKEFDKMMDVKIATMRKAIERRILDTFGGRRMEEEEGVQALMQDQDLINQLADEEVVRIRTEVGQELQAEHERRLSDGGDSLMDAERLSFRLVLKGEGEIEVNAEAFNWASIQRSYEVDLLDGVNSPIDYEYVLPLGSTISLYFRLKLDMRAPLRFIAQMAKSGRLKASFAAEREFGPFNATKTPGGEWELDVNTPGSTTSLNARLSSGDITARLSASLGFQAKLHLGAGFYIGPFAKIGVKAEVNWEAAAGFDAVACGKSSPNSTLACYPMSSPFSNLFQYNQTHVADYTKVTKSPSRLAAGYAIGAWFVVTLPNASFSVSGEGIAKLLAKFAKVPDSFDTGDFSLWHDKFLFRKAIALSGGAVDSEVSLSPLSASKPFRQLLFSTLPKHFPPLLPPPALPPSPPPPSLFPFLHLPPPHPPIDDSYDDVYPQQTESSVFMLGNTRSNEDPPPSWWSNIQDRFDKVAKMAVNIAMRLVAEQVKQQAKLKCEGFLKDSKFLSKVRDTEFCWNNSDALSAFRDHTPSMSEVTNFLDGYVPTKYFDVLDGARFSVKAAADVAVCFKVYELTLDARECTVLMDKITDELTSTEAVEKREKEMTEYVSHPNGRAMTDYVERAGSDLARARRKLEEGMSEEAVAQLLAEDIARAYMERIVKEVAEAAQQERLESRSRRLDGSDDIRMSALKFGVYFKAGASVGMEVPPDDIVQERSLSIDLLDELYKKLGVDTVMLPIDLQMSIFPFISLYFQANLDVRAPLRALAQLSMDQRNLTGVLYTDFTANFTYTPRSEATNDYETDPATLGTYGGVCKCPNGETYEVSDHYDNCASLACYGGDISSPCVKEMNKVMHKRVRCEQPTVWKIEYGKIGPLVRLRDASVSAALYGSVGVSMMFNMRAGINIATQRLGVKLEAAWEASAGFDAVVCARSTNAGTCYAPAATSLMSPYVEYDTTELDKWTTEMSKVNGAAMAIGVWGYATILKAKIGLDTNIGLLEDLLKPCDKEPGNIRNESPQEIQVQPRHPYGGYMARKTSLVVGTLTDLISKVFD